MTTGKTVALTRRTFVGKIMSLLLNILFRLVITFLPRSKCLLISWLQSPSAMILEVEFHVNKLILRLSSVQSFSHIWLFVTPWTAACHASLSITNAQSLFKLMSIKSVMSFNHLILCCSLLLLPSIFPSIRVFSNESVLHLRWPKYWSFSFSISPSNEYSGLISFRIDWVDLLLSKRHSRLFS